MRNRSTIFMIGMIVLLAGVLLALSSPAAAQDGKPTPSDDEVNRVAKQMYCPVCENIPLDVCPTQACKEWRDLIRLKLSEGWTDQQIKEYFALQYGDRVLAEPPRRGLNWLVYLIPPLFLFGGAVLVWRILASMRKKTVESDAAAEAHPAVPSARDDPYLARLEDELKKKD